MYVGTVKFVPGGGVGANIDRCISSQFFSILYFYNLGYPMLLHKRYNNTYMYIICNRYCVL